jgi:hypothetical protein
MNKNPFSAYEVMTKIKSNQYIHQKAGQSDASFEELDQQGFECAQIN